MLEICVDSVSSALAAQAGGATRLECCTSMVEGGTTPSIGLVKSILSKVSIPVHAMVRPRGGDFLYSPSEIDTMREDITALKQAGVAGVVLGVLTANGLIDEPLLRELVGFAAPLPVTFHRAIDAAVDPVDAVLACIRCGVARILSSGGAPTALEGAATLTKMAAAAGSKLILAAGGGLSQDNVAALAATGVKELHGSLKAVKSSAMRHNSAMSMQFGGPVYEAQTGLVSAVAAACVKAGIAATGEQVQVSSSGGSFHAKGSLLEKEIEYQRQQDRKYAASGKPLLWDFDDLLVYAEGDIAPVFNKHLSGTHPPWSLIDTYPRRVRLPQREYLLCSRVTKMQATTGVYEPCTMTTEYDLPVDGELSEGGDVPWAVLVESGQCDLMLISYLGIDFQNKGIRVYRLLDTTLTFYGVAKEGQTLCYDISINSFAKKQGQVTMFFFSYNCYVDGKLLIEMRNGVAGFFTNEELDEGKGVVWTVAENKMRAKAAANKKDPTPCMLAPATKSFFSEADMQRLSEEGHKPGTWGQVLGPTASDVLHKLCARKMLMIDRVTHVIPRGGVHGLGLLIGEKILERDHWYFPCHFKHDQVMAGSLVSDGCSQILKLYMLHLGMHRAVDSVTFRPVYGQQNKVRCRGQISPHKGKLVYWVEIAEMGFDKKTGFPYARANVNIIDVNYELGQTFDYPDEESLLQAITKYGKGDLSHKIVVDFNGVALQIEGPLSATHPWNAGAAPAKSLTPLPPHASAIPAPLISGYDVGGLHLSGGFRSPLPPTQYMKWGGPVQVTAGGLSWHPLAGKNGNPTPGFRATAFPPRPICFLPFPGNPNDTNHTPGELPLSWVNICEFMCNNLSECMGPEYKRFDESNSSRSPAFDLCFSTRVLSCTGMEQVPGSKKWYGVDTNPGTGTMVAEFDCPADAWFFEGSSQPDLMPYSILMEIALQTCGILTTWNKAPLTVSETVKSNNLLFRNLDATAKLLAKVDLRNKTIKNVSKATGYAMLGSMGVQKFTTMLSVDGVDFYQVDSSFGWFIPSVFENQVGLDNAVYIDCWHERPEATLAGGAEKMRGKTVHTYDLNTQESSLFARAGPAYAAMRRRAGQCKYLDGIHIVEKSGMHGKGYAHGYKHVDPKDWFFSCHFWCDPVMPGSLGIEAMHQSLELFCVHTAAAEGIHNPRFEHDLGKTVWSYRGQLTPKNKLLSVEVHVKKCEKEGGDIVVHADGFLYVDRLRTYKAVDLRVRIVSGGVAQPMPVPTAVQLTLPAANGPPGGLGTPIAVTAGDTAGVRRALLDVSRDVVLELPGGATTVVAGVPWSSLGAGSQAFMDLYGVKYPMYTGAMAKGIASADLVIAAGKNGMLGSLGAGGLPPHRVQEALDKVQAALPNGPYAVNLIHSPFDDLLEKRNVELFLDRGVRIIEASAFMKLTPHVVRYRVAGLSRDPVSGKTLTANKIIFKVSRTELAQMALRAPPADMVEKLLKQGYITAEQAALAPTVTMCDDVAVEADSGGHTDNRHMPVLLPVIIACRDAVAKETGMRVRVGAGGGIGCPEAAAAAFAMGADFIVTGSINQMSRQSGTCDTVRKQLSQATYSDVVMAPAADMFDEGVKLQVLKKGTMFASRALKLYELFVAYPSLDALPEKEVAKLEKTVFRKPISQVWDETVDFTLNALKDPDKIERANKDPKLKMSLVFRWYLGLSSGWANAGVTERSLDFQVWCGPAIGAFNDFIRGTYLDPAVSGVFHDVHEANLQILRGACFLRRCRQLQADAGFNAALDSSAVSPYRPEPF